MKKSVVKFQKIKLQKNEKCKNNLYSLFTHLLQFINILKYIV